MTFTISSSTLLKKLQVVGGVINSNNTMAILDNFLFEITDNQLIISASDLETTIRSKVEISNNSEQQSKSIAVPHKLLIDILKTFADQPLTFTINDNNSVDIQSTNGKYSLAYVSSEGFPSPVEITNSKSVSFLGDVLATAIQKTIFATRTDDLRPVMGGVLFEFSPEGIVFAATDAHKLVKYERLDIQAPEAAEFVMPKKPLNILRNILSASEEQVQVQYNENNAKFSFDNMEFICRLIDGKFPNYNAVIPTENPNKLTINRASILSTCKRAQVMANKSTHQINLKVSNNILQVTAEDADFSNKATETLPCNYHGDDLEIGFNSKFFIEMLSNLSSEEVLLEMSFSNRPGVLSPADGLDEGEKVTMLVMPIMVND